MEFLILPIISVAVSAVGVAMAAYNLGETHGYKDGRADGYRLGWDACADKLIQEADEFIASCGDEATEQEK